MAADSEQLQEAVRAWIKADFRCLRKPGRSTEEFVKWNQRLQDAQDGLRLALTGTTDPFDAMKALGYEVDKPYSDNEKPITSHRDYKPMVEPKRKGR